MIKFQIQFTRDGCGSYEYFEATPETAKKIACETADKFHERRKSSRSIFNSYQPFRTVKVVEYDNEKKCVKRGGIKFKIRLSGMSAKFSSGRVTSAEWYEPVD
jgi:hypothetical protein